MAGTVSKAINLVRNMGWRYTAYRTRYELLRKSGLLKKKFPASPPFTQFIMLEEWKKQPCRFFFDNKKGFDIPHNPSQELESTYKNIEQGKLLLFNSVLADLGTGYDWVTNPDSKFHYDVNKHWTEIADYSREAGDIKFVWEKSRFSYLYDIIRYDHHFSKDCAAMVFGDIISWINANPVNCGPNYRCSQEMSLRVLNWTFALHYYRDAPQLTDEVFNKMQYAIYWHMHHVYNNINFSRIAVRNNHAITETLALYLVGLLYPSLPGAGIWKTKGKVWFEQEIAYQVYDDGTYLQFSMNYNRIVVQLLTWAITLSERNNERLNEVVYGRARKSVQFLRACMADGKGWLPNYGANDGALFFKLNSGHYRDYRGQLQALALAVGMDLGFESEDALWYGIKKRGAHWAPGNGTYAFEKGGYYIIREPDTLTFIKCGGYKDRPSQADNLHMDIWYKGENILPDAGTYKYNTDDQTIRYFSGTQSHNTVMLDDKDQMLKGGRFIWFYWSQQVSAAINEGPEEYTFTGTIKVFSYLKDGIMHKRTIVKKKSVPEWQVKDEIIGAPAGIEMKQLWHTPIAVSGLTILQYNKQGGEAPPLRQDGWYSSLYGQKEKTNEYYFSTRDNIIHTTIKIDPIR